MVFRFRIQGRFGLRHGLLMPTSLLQAATGTKDGAAASSAAENANHGPGALL